jgi:hypothetical protein
MPRGCGSIDQVFNVLLNLELNFPSVNDIQIHAIYSGGLRSAGRGEFTG